VHILNNLTSKEKTLHSIIAELKLFPALLPFPKITWDNIKFHPESIEILETFELLGGKTSTPIWQNLLPVFYFENLIICLDDETAFNRYRKITLQSSVYSHLKIRFNKFNYTRFCRSKESECLKSARTGNDWNNNALVSVFGESDPQGQLYDNGSNVWKNKAFSDFMLDCIPLFYPNFTIVRISVWDEILINGKITQLNNFILQPDIHERNALKRMLKKHLGIIDKEDLFTFKS